MQITIKGNAKEIAALEVQAQERQNAKVCRIMDFPGENALPKPWHLT